jgi:ankyrin repeat protein
MNKYYKYKEKYLRLKGGDDKTDLIKAVNEKKSTDYVYNLLMKSSQSPNIADENGNSLLLLAVSRGDMNMVQFLLRSDIGGNIDVKNNKRETALILASSLGYKEIVEFLLPRSYFILQDKDEEKETALTKAWKNNHIEIVKLLANQYGYSDFTNPEKNPDYEDISKQFTIQMSSDGKTELLPKSSWFSWK